MRALGPRLPTLACLLLALSASSAVADCIESPGGSPDRPAAYRRLFQAPAPSADLVQLDLTEEAAGAVKDAVMSADGHGGPFTDWVVACAPGCSRCPSLFLASWGFQCSTMDGTSCCLQPNGKFCARLERWADAGVPPSWRGGDNATTTIGSGGSGGGGGVAASESAGNRSSTVWGQSASMQEEQEKEDSGKPWRKATATYFNAYPACCTDDGADSTECDDFSGCEWAGQFAGVSGKKSRSWVRERNIVAFFEAGRSEEWAERWKGKTLRLRNPETGSTLEAEVLDTCSDDDCDGCCTSNALKNGGYLIDLEAATAERFWEGDVHGLAAIQRQVV